MRILEIATERVRNLPDRTWPLAPGLQILQGPNEAGKSALHEALRIGLYGDAASTAAVVLRAQRWGSAEGMCVRVRLDVPGGPFDIVRDFAEKKNVLIGPDGVRRRGQQALDEVLRHHLPLPTLESFLATACVRQDELARVVADATALRPLLEQHALSGGGVDLEELQKRLDRHLAELRRGVDRPAPRNPGRIAVLLEQQRHWSEARAALARTAEAQTQAALRLAALRQTLAGAQEEATRKRTHLERHLRYQEATRQLAAAQQRVGAAQARLDRAAHLTAELPGLTAAAAQATVTLTAQQARLDRAERHYRLSQDTATLRAECDQLGGELEQLGTLAAELAAHEAARRAIPLSLEEVASLRAIPGEIAKLAHDVQGADAERTRLGGRLEELARVIAADRGRLTALADEQAARVTALAAADARQGAEAALQTTLQAIAAREPRLARLQGLQAEVRRLEAQLHPTAYLDTADVAALPGLMGRVAALRAALSHRGFEVRLTPRQPLSLTVQADTEPVARYPDQAEPVVIPAGTTVAIGVDGVLDLEVQNHSTAATELATAQEQLHRLLDAMRCGTAQEAEALLGTRKTTAGALQTARAQLQAALDADSVEALADDLARLRGQQAALARTLATLPAADQAPDALRAALQATAVEIGALQATLLAREQDRDRTNLALAADPVAGARAELARKAEALAALQTRLGVDFEAADALEGQLQEFARQVAGAEAARAALLGGRTPDRMLSRRTEAGAALAALEAEVAPLAPDALDAEGIQAARADLRASEQDAKVVEAAHLRATTELGTIDIPTLTAEKDAAVLQAALAQKAMADTQDFQLGPEDRIRVETRLGELDAALPSLQQECARLEVQAAAEADLQSRLAEADERLAGLERQLQYWQRRLRVDGEIRCLLDAARGRAVADLAERHLPALIGRYLAAATGNRHGDVRASDDGFAVWSPEKGAALEAEELSTGTRDQFYLAVRLAHLAALFPIERPPLLLDDPLVHCDPTRRAAVLRLLAEYATSGQVLLFTCHEFPEYQAYPTLGIAP